MTVKYIISTSYSMAKDYMYQENLRPRPKIIVRADDLGDIELVAGEYVILQGDWSFGGPFWDQIQARIK